MFIWVCFLDPVGIPQPLGILGEFGLGWALPKTKSEQPHPLPAILIVVRALSHKSCEDLSPPFLSTDSKSHIF